MNKRAEFLSNRPLGKDLLDGQSQDYVALAIKRHIEEVDAKKDDENALPRIIGVEGSWGSGKSNMLLQLQEKLKSNYYFFTYDAWGNQEDLQRRSILESLTDELIQKEMLVKDTQIKVLDTDLDKEPTIMRCSWKRRLFSLVARKSTTHNVAIPKMEGSTKAFALMLLITAIVPTLMAAMKPANVPCWYPWVILGATLFPFFVFLICKWANKWKWSVMWKMYQTGGKTDTATYSISELEPTVTEFREWMNDLADSLIYGCECFMKFSAACYECISVLPEGVHADVQSIDSRLRKLFDHFGELLSIRRQCNLFNTRDLLHFTNQIHATFAHERLAACYLVSADSHVSCRLTDAQDFFVCQNTIHRHFLNALGGHTIPAPQITSVGDGDTHVIDFSAVSVYHLICQIRSSGTYIYRSQGRVRPDPVCRNLLWRESLLQRREAGPDRKSFSSHT